MIRIREIAIAVVLTVTSGCGSDAPARSSVYAPVTVASALSGLTCDELDYKLNGYRKQIKNVAIDHPVDTAAHADSLQYYMGGVKEAITNKGCAIDLAEAPKEPVANAGAANPIKENTASGVMYCFAHYVRNDITNMNQKKSTGVIVSPWRASETSKEPARAAISSFQDHAISESPSSFKPVECTSGPDFQVCNIASELGDFNLVLHMAFVSCSTSLMNIENNYASRLVQYPLLRKLAWMPTGASAIPAK